LLENPRVASVSHPPRNLSIKSVVRGSISADFGFSTLQFLKSKTRFCLS